MFSPVAEMIVRGMNPNYYVRTFATRHEALAHAVEKNVEADAPLAYLAVHGLEDDYAVVLGWNLLGDGLRDASLTGP